MDLHFKPSKLMRIKAVQMQCYNVNVSNKLSNKTIDARVSFFVVVTLVGKFDKKNLRQ